MHMALEFTYHVFDKSAVSYYSYSGTGSPRLARSANLIFIEREEKKV